MEQMQPASHRTEPVFDLVLCGPEHPARARLERYIALRYARRHGARVERFAPWLLAILADGRPGAALGLRCPGAQPLALETYLDRPLEVLLAERVQRPVARPQLIEIGNLAASDRAARRLLFAALVTLLARTGHRWLACTATARVRCLIQAMGLPLVTLAAADASRLGAELARWGTYYGCGPEVVAGEIAIAGAAIAARTELGAALAPLRPALDRAASLLR